MASEISEHFREREFWDKRQSPAWNEAAVRRFRRNLIAIAGVLEQLRALDDRPLPVLSGIRSTATNRAVGGARGSLHLRGAAADIPSGRYTVAQAVSAGARGVGHCGGWVVHVDTRRTRLPVIFEDC